MPLFRPSNSRHALQRSELVMYPHRGHVLCTAVSTVSLMASASPLWIMSRHELSYLHDVTCHIFVPMIALGRMRSRSLRKVRACPLKIGAWSGCPLHMRGWITPVCVWRVNALCGEVVEILEVGIHHNLLLVCVQKRLGARKLLVRSRHNI